MRQFLLSGLAAIALSFGQAKAAESIEAGVTEIANQIVANVDTDGSFTVGITNFYHADNTCSYLSNDLVDLISFSLLKEGQGKIELFERQMLPVVLDEIRFNLSGPIDPNTAAKPGRISGVDALIIGKITERPDRIRVLARLVATNTAKVMSMAITDFPKTASLAGQTATRSADACGISATMAAGTSPREGTTPPAPAPSTPPTDKVFTADGFEARVVRVVYSKSEKTANVVMRFTNTQDTPIRLAYTKSSLATTDGLGNIMPWKDVFSGLKVCNSYTYNCTFKTKDQATEIGVGKQAQLTFNVSHDGTEAPANMSIAMELIYSPNPKDVNDYKLIAMGLFDIKPEVK